jgi:hypothetical protein
MSFVVPKSLISVDLNENVWNDIDLNLDFSQINQAFFIKSVRKILEKS